MVPEISTLLSIVLFASGVAAGLLGALLGLGGGVFLVPLLVLVLHLPMRLAVGISLSTVIATSSVVTSGRLGRSVVNLRLGMVLEVATTAGGLTGGIVAAMLAPATLQRMFGVVAVLSAAVMVTRLERRNVLLDSRVDVGRLGGRYYEEESGAVVAYRVRRLPLAMAVSFVAGSVSSLLGLGGGIFKVPALTAWCGVPLRAAAATSAFMIGVTATAGAVIYYGRGEIVAWMAASAVLGVLVGSRAGFALGERARAKWLKLLLVAVLLAVGVLMLAKIAMTPPHTGRLERWLANVLRWGTALSTSLLAAGLVLELAGASRGVATRLASAGLVILMATPIVRVAASVGDYLLARDWLFAGLTVAVLLTLLTSVAVAFL